MDYVKAKNSSLNLQYFQDKNLAKTELKPHGLKDVKRANAMFQ